MIGACERSIRRASYLGALIVAIGCSGVPKAGPPASSAPTDTRMTARVAARSARPVKPKAVAPKLPDLPAVLMGKPPATEQPKTAATTDPSLPDDAALQEAWARVFLRSNPGPYQYVAYEITARGNAGVISHLRATMGRRDPIIRTELIERDKLRRIMARLRDLGAGSLVDPGPLVATKPANRGKRSKRKRRRGTKASAALEASDATTIDDDAPPRWPRSSAVPIYELSFRLDGAVRTVVVADPYASSDHRYAEFINAVREEVIGTVGDIAWHEGTASDATAGYLFVDSVPSASVLVDGAKLPEKTPIFAHALSPGAHTVVLHNAAQGLERTYKIKIRHGMTTSLEVNLR